MITGSQQYEVLARLASGGMAEVFLARRRGVLGFEKLLVVKKILPELAGQSEIVDMFVDEARIAGQLNHPNIVQVFDLGADRDDYYIVMEYLFGESLATILKILRKRGSWLPPGLSAGILLQASAGVDHAHGATDPTGRKLGIVHRDISPHNLVVLYQGVVKVVDFGIAKSTDRLARTRTGMLKGKLPYMAPEQIQGNTDPRSDVFSLGIVFWECLTSRRLFRGKTEYDIMKAIVEGDVPDLRDVSPTVPEAFAPIAARALARDPAARFQSAGELHAALADVLRRLGMNGDPEAIGEFLRSNLRPEMDKKKSVIEEARAGTDSDVLQVDHDLHPFLDSAAAAWDSDPSSQVPGPVFSWGEADGEPLELDYDRARQFAPEARDEPPADPSPPAEAPRITPAPGPVVTREPSPAAPSRGPASSRDPESLSRALDQFLMSWFRPGGITMLICLGVALYFLRLPFLLPTNPLSAIGTAISVMVFAGVLLHVAQLAWEGTNLLPGVDVFSNASVVFVPGGLLVAATAIVWIPMLILAVHVGPFKSVPLVVQLLSLDPAFWLGEPVMIVVFLLAFWYLHATALTVLETGDAGRAMNPLRVFDVMSHHPAAYLGSLVLLVALLAFQIGIKHLTAAALAAAGPRRFTSLYLLGVLFEVAHLVLPLIGAFLLGYLQRRTTLSKRVVA